MKIVIIEDEPIIVEVLQSYFEKEGYEVFYAYNGAEGLELIQQIKPDFVVLDLMLPDILGEEICREIRKDSTVPIMILTAKTAEDDRIHGIEIGADDYITKPFSPREVVVRTKGILRRLEGQYFIEEWSFNENSLIIKVDQKEVMVNKEKVKLTPIEFSLLVELAQNPGRVYSRLDLLKVAQEDTFYEGYERSIDVHIKNLRKKIENNPKEPLFLVTVYGIGYKFGGVLDATNS